MLLREEHPFPRARLVALAWLGIYLPSYALAYGMGNFLFLCNLGVFVTCLGLWRGSALLLSSQAVGVIVVDVVWTLDFLLRIVTGTHLVGGTEYMWDPQWPAFTRALSLYHAAMPVILVYALRRVGYDRRGWALQSAITVVAVVAGRLLGPEMNVNHAFVDPIFKRSWEPAVLHVAIVVGALVLVAYPLTHAVLSRWLPAAESRGG